MRQSGILLHITSLPSPYGIGDLGPSADKFLSFLKKAGQSVWQVLPLNPTDPISDNSPYTSCSAFAGNVLLISPELLREEGLLTQEDLVQTPDFDDSAVEFEKVIRFKELLLTKAYTRFQPSGDFESFILRNISWLKDYALFQLIKKKQQGQCWADWPEAYKNRYEDALEEIAAEQKDAMQEIYFRQFLFFKQWHRFKRQANVTGISLMGDIPIYVNYDSVDVWVHRPVFKLDAAGCQEVVAGVPPDYFSATGQRWGNPVYDWDYLEETDFVWWVERLKHNLALCDILRIDHFRAFVNYWEIPATEPTAVKGHWVKAPTDAFFKHVRQAFPEAGIVAEDLGQIEPKVLKKIRAIGYPGMKVLMFAFGGNLKTHMYLPHNYEENCVVYTGTHDNNTVQGWFKEDASPKERANFLAYAFGEDIEDVHREMVRLGLASKARLALFPMQDILGLGQEARMNTPGTGSGNWRWRLQEMQINTAPVEWLAQETGRADRK